ncbi:hypothetical protein MN116_002115 [Schistosoma mekongi]|uniref:Zinc transporter n=1 Tax=Schistosoma mekongi TaxID=38744 RepID=A0AAE2D8I4_SCHME|nr:hypothetical protein MN116_002115 [Schistosoma mekongi]
MRLVAILFSIQLWIHVSGHDHEAPHYKYSREANVGHKISHINEPRKDSPEQLWLEVFGAVSLISIAPFIILCLIPDLNKHRGFLKVLLAFAAGGLLGDAFLHLIPHALESKHSDHNLKHGEKSGNEDDHVHDHRRHCSVGLYVVGGIFAFLCVEKCIRLFRNDHCEGHVHHVSNANGDNKGKNKKKSEDVKSRTKTESKDFKVTGYLNLAADFAHNFTDGLAIGGSFLVSRNVGFLTTFTVLLHELPHEIGDYAILIQSGFSSRKAMLLQLITAIGALLGASVSLLAARVSIGPIVFNTDMVPTITDDVVTGCILPFTAGGFIYIAMTSVLPDLLGASSTSITGSAITKTSNGGGLKLFIQSLFEIISLIGGVAMMTAIGTLE